MEKNAMSERKVILGVTGSIAAYKAVELLRMMKKRGWDVTVVMTRAAEEFVGELTFRTLSQNEVAIEMFDDVEDWRPDHIALVDEADVMVLAPCTANVIAKTAHGIADDMLSCTVLAFDGPVIIAPAMNEKMWNNPATRENVETLKSRGIAIVDVESGDLACGVEGSGRLASLEAILQVIDRTLGDQK
jgi:phosphopantothenoylcysteine synthetase/decarboxylase